MARYTVRVHPQIRAVVSVEPERIRPSSKDHDAGTQTVSEALSSSCTLTHKMADCRQHGAVGETGSLKYLQSSCARSAEALSGHSLYSK